MYRRRERIGVGWAGTLYSGEDANGRAVRLIPLKHCALALREEIRDRHNLLTTRFVSRALPSLGIHVIDGIPYWIGGWRNGVPLTVALSEHRLPHKLLMSIGQQVAVALFEALQVGVVHGDLHPSAIWLASNGEVWIDGFGRQSSSSAPLRTSPLAYVSPEGAASSANDVYSLGAILVEAFVGAAPSSADLSEREHQLTIATIQESLRAAGVSKALTENICSLLNFDPMKRPTVDVLSQKWDLPSPETLLRSWLLKEYPQVAQSGAPEQKVPQPISEYGAHKNQESIEQTEEPSSDEEKLDEYYTEKSDVQATVPLEDFQDKTEALPLPRQTPSANKPLLLNVDEWEDQPINFHSNPLFGTEATIKLTPFDVPAMSAPLLEEVEETKESALLNDPFADESNEFEGIVDDDLEAEFLNSDVTQQIYGDETDAFTDWVETFEEPSPPTKLYIGLATFAVCFLIGSYALLFQDDEEMTEMEAVEEVVEMEEFADVDQEDANRLPEGFVPPPTLEELQQRELERQLSAPVDDGNSEPVVQAVPEAPARARPRAQRRAPRKTPVRPSTPTSKSPAGTSEEDGWLAVTPLPAEQPIQKEQEVEDPWAPEPDPWAVSAKPEEKTEKVAVVQPGQVVVEGEVDRVTLTKDGRPYSAGSLPPGTYSVDVIFEGLNRISVGDLVVESGRKHKIKCNAAFALCSFQ